jgi:PhnB protein
MQLNPYLMFEGQCEEAFKFYAKVLNGKILAMLTHEGTPAAGQTPPEWRKKIIHARLQVGDHLLMGSDAPPGRQSGRSGFTVNVSVDTPAEAERIFNALIDGGRVHMTMQETFWAQRFGMLVDRYGTPWMINCEKPQ